MSELTIYGLYLIYYSLLVGFIILPLLIWKRKTLIKGTSYFSQGREEESSSIVKSKKKDIRIYQAVFVVFILIFMPLAHYSSTTLIDGLMDRTRIYRGQGSYLDSPVENQIGPNYDTDMVIEKMEEEEYYWHDWIVESVKEEIDFDETTRLPGRLGVYYLRRSLGGSDHRQHNVIITYSYFSPIPITRVYGFHVYPEHETISLEEDHPITIIYPMDPADADPF